MQMATCGKRSDSSNYRFHIIKVSYSKLPLFCGHVNQ